jgi:hypothetical protein
MASSEGQIVAGWKITTTTIYCRGVGEMVTHVVYRDWSAKCSGQRRYGAGSSEKRGGLLKGAQKKGAKGVECEGPNCPEVKAFVDQLMTEENE